MRPARRKCSDRPVAAPPPRPGDQSLRDCGDRIRTQGIACDARLEAVAAPPPRPGDQALETAGLGFEPRASLATPGWRPWRLRRPGRENKTWRLRGEGS